MPAGSATGTELWGAAVIIIRSEGPQPGFRIIVDRSHAGFIEDWLTVASGGTSALRPGVMIAPPRSWEPS
jgi:sarcosine oxidase gamma subunit